MHLFCLYNYKIIQLSVCSNALRHDRERVLRSDIRNFGRLLSFFSSGIKLDENTYILNT